MSHFLVMVIGNDPEKQLAPYHEFECTGQDDQYVQDIDETESLRTEYEEYKKEKAERVLVNAEEEKEMSFYDYVTDYHGYNVVKFGKKPNKKSHKYRYALVNEAGEITKVVRRTNQNAKWDWYQLGGRYTGRLILKEGKEGTYGEPSLLINRPAGIDQAMKGDIDLETMRIDAAEDAGKQYDIFAKATEGLPWPESWESVRERYGDKRMEEARAFYGEQPLVKAMRKCRDIYPLSSPEDYGQDRSVYIQRMVNKCGVPFAFVKDGKWHERGEMGWFALVRDEKDENVWNQEFWKMFNALPDNTLISMIDCHI